MYGITLKAAVLITLIAQVATNFYYVGQINTGSYSFINPFLIGGLISSFIFSYTSLKMARFYKDSVAAQSMYITSVFIVRLYACYGVFLNYEKGHALAPLSIIIFPEYDIILLILFHIPLAFFCKKKRGSPAPLRNTSNKLP
jgi:hypothetical protein